MTVQKLVNRIFQRYGVSVEVHHNDTTATVRGFVHYTATSARKHLLPSQTSLGKIPQGHCRLLLPQHTAAEGDLVSYDNRWYIVRMVERVWLGDEAIYDRCLCEERGGYDSWGR